jgi:hypothetical protein
MKYIYFIIPHTTSFLAVGNNIISFIDVKAPSNVPNILSSPSVNNIRKNRTDHNCGTGNWLIASVKAINANPVPEAAYNKANNISI